MDLHIFCYDSLSYVSRALISVKGSSQWVHSSKFQATFSIFPIRGHRMGWPPYSPSRLKVFYVILAEIVEICVLMLNIFEWQLLSFVLFDICLNIYSYTDMLNVNACLSLYDLGHRVSLMMQKSYIKSRVFVLSV